MSKHTLTEMSNKRVGFAIEFCVALAVALAAWASMIFPLNYSQDTYRFLNFPEGADFYLFASEMRAFGYFLIRFLDAIGAHYPYAGALWPILFTASLVFAGLVTFRIWVPEAGSLVFITGATLFTLFPYQSDYLSFHNAAPSYASYLVLGWAALFFCLRSLPYFALAFLALVYCVSGQIVFGFMFLVVLVEALLWAYRRVSSGAFRFDGALVLSARPWIVRFVLLFASAVGYVLVSKLILVATGTTAGTRLEISGLAEYPAKALLYVKNSYYFLLKGEVSLPGAVKVVQLSLLAVVGFAGISAVIKNPASRLCIAFAWGLLMLLTVTAVGVCMGVMLPIKNAYELMNPRTLSALSVYWAGVFALAWALSTGRMRKFATVTGIFLAFCYAVNVNRQSVDFARINERDRLTASRMVERLSLLPGFPEVRTVVLVGADHTFNIDRISTETAGFNISSLYRPYSSTAVLREVSGTLFEYPSEKDRQAAQAASLGQPHWPLPGSAFIYRDIGVVVLGDASTE